jgi:hypothetical protein
MGTRTNFDSLHKQLQVEGAKDIHTSASTCRLFLPTKKAFWQSGLSTIANIKDGPATTSSLRDDHPMYNKLQSQAS